MKFRAQKTSGEIWLKTIFILLLKILYISISIITFTKTNCLTYKCGKNTIREIYYKKALLSRCPTMMNKVLCIFSGFQLFQNCYHSYMFSVVYSSIPKITNISIMKPIIFISIMN